MDVDVPARRPPRRPGHPVVPGGLCFIPGRRHLDRVSGEGRANPRALIEVEGRAVDDRACGDRREVESEDGTRLRVEPVQDQGRVGPMVHVYILLVQPRILADGRGRLQAEKGGRARGCREGDVAGRAGEVHVRHVVRRREVRRGRAVPPGHIPFKGRGRPGDLGIGHRIVGRRCEVPDRRRCAVAVVHRRRIRVGGRDRETRQRSQEENADRGDERAAPRHASDWRGDSSQRESGKEPGVSYLRAVRWLSEMIIWREPLLGGDPT